MNKTIFAMGGGGFSMEPETPLLDQYILNLSHKENPKVSFIGSASGDAANYIDKFYSAFKNHSCQSSHLSLFKPHTADIEDYVLSQDILYVGGGNTKNLLCLWRDWSLDSIIRKAYENGCILSGISAGSICWFEQGLTDSFGTQLEAISCLGLIPGSNSPHFDGEKERKPRYTQLINEGKMKEGYAADDSAGILFQNGEFIEAVCSVPGKKVYYVEPNKINPVPTRYLG